MHTASIYLKSSLDLNEQTIKLLFEKIGLSNYSLDWQQNKGTLFLENYEVDYVVLKNSFSAFAHDLMCNFLGVVVPKFDLVFEKAIPHINRSGFYHFHEFLPYLLNSNYLHVDDFKFLFEKISEEVLETIKAYLELDMSITMVSKTIYTHRNTVNYRISRFIDITGIDIRNTINGYFVYSIITWNR